MDYLTLREALRFLFPLQNLLPDGLASNKGAARRLGPEGGWSPLPRQGKPLADELLRQCGARILAFGLN